MEKKNAFLWTIANTSVIIFVFILFHGIYIGITTKPTELDSLRYHIPIAKSILDGTVFNPIKTTTYHRYFPGSSEAILSLFMLLHVPLNLYNVLGLIAFCSALYHLGKQNNLRRELAIIYAVSVCGMMGVARWINVQIIDIWLDTWFALALLLLQKPQDNMNYFLLLGIVSGFLIGSKYSGPLYFGVLCFFYWKKIRSLCSFKNCLSFLTTFTFFGLFWYIRNYIARGNPFYPLAVFCLPGFKNYNLHFPMWKAVVKYPLSMTSAFISEYGIWTISLIITPIIWMYRKKKDTIVWIILGTILVYLTLPSDFTYSVHVSNLRYGYPTISLSILTLFSISQEFKKEKWIAVIVLVNLLSALQISYHPKLLLILVPVSFLIFFHKRVLSFLFP